MNKIDLNNRVAIVTGGAQGFGYSMVQRFSESGATVIIWDKDKNLMESLSLPKNIHTMEVDITTYEDVENATNQVLKKFNSIDILVNNAGTNFPEPFAKIKQESMNYLIVHWNDQNSVYLSIKEQNLENAELIAKIQTHLFSQMEKLYKNFHDYHDFPS